MTAAPAIADPPVRAVHLPARGDLQALIDASPIAIIQVDRAGIVQEWNGAAHRLLGWSGEELIGRPLPTNVLEVELDIPRLLTTLDAGVPTPVFEVRCRCRDGHTIYVELSSAATRGPAGEVRGVVGLLVDVTERKRLEQKLEHLAYHDSLTGLPNRELLTQRLAEALAAADPDGATGLLLIDLDRFKEVNNTLGYACGDQLLAQIGRRLVASAVRERDTVARLSGDQFAVLLPEVADVPAAVAVAERVLTALHAPFPVGGTMADIAASIGVAVAPDHGPASTDLLRHADAAMYEAKGAATGVAVYDPGRRERGPMHFGMLGELRRALEGDELVVHYQPQVDVGTGTLCGVEALVRWQHPRRGLLQPAEFIPLSETTGLIRRLTTRVLDIALTQARRWSQAGLRVPVAVNLSAQSLDDRDLASRVRAALTRHGVAPGLLCLEITESAIMRDPTGALEVLAELAAGGVKLSLDDFGTGYSSMTYLRRLPVVELKIDRSFVSDLAAEQADAVLVRSVVDLGHNLGLSVVAEGVEDVQTLGALRRLGCDVAQGYHLGRPMPGDELCAWLAARSAAGTLRARGPAA